MNEMQAKVKKDVSNSIEGVRIDGINVFGEYSRYLQCSQIARVSGMRDCLEITLNTLGEGIK